MRRSGVVMTDAPHSRKKSSPSHRSKRSGSGNRPNRHASTERPSKSGHQGSRTSSDRNGFKKDGDRPRRLPRIEPEISPDVEAKMLPGRLRAELLSLSAENGEVVAKQLVMMQRLLGSDDTKEIQLAHEFGRAASNRAGRVAVVRRVAGKAALANKDFAEAKRHFSAALRISGLAESKIRLAECETGLGRPRKALEILGEIRSETLSQKEVADALLISAEAREALGQNDAARVTLSHRAETFLTESLARDETDPEIRKIADRWLALKKRL